VKTPLHRAWPCRREAFVFPPVGKRDFRKSGNQLIILLKGNPVYLLKNSARAARRENHFGVFPLEMPPRRFSRRAARADFFNKRTGFPFHRIIN
jgi:hypothetical protein